MDDSPEFDAIHEEELAAILKAREQIGLPPRKHPATEPYPLLGLALSGGGIRSATFNLGVLQALARRRLLREVDFLSTVSGGGYIGAWLSAWIYRSSRNVTKVEDALVEGLVSIDPPQVYFLRRYSNYLTARLGLFGADTWGAIATYLRNTLLNLVILCATLCALLLAPRLLTRLVSQGTLGSWAVADVADAFAVTMLALASAMVGYNLHAVDRRGSKIDRGAAPGRLLTQTYIQWLIVVPALLAAIAVSISIWTPDPNAVVWWPKAFVTYAILWLLMGGVWITFSWLHRDGAVQVRSRSDWLWLVGVAVGSALISGLFAALALWAISGLFDRTTNPWLTLTLGIPLVVGVFSWSAILQIGLLGRRMSDESREWWSRLGGWFLIYALSWMLLLAGSFYSALLVAWAGRRLTAAGTLAWIASTGVGILAARSPATGSAAPTATRRKQRSTVLELLAAVAPYTFIVGIIILLSTAIHALLLHLEGKSIPDMIARYASGYGSGGPALAAAHDALMVETSEPTLCALVFGAIVVVAVVLSWRVDINAFSLHALYRDRLVRCYLGASNDNRRAHPFTGFDPDDDFALDALGGGRSRPAVRPLHLVNTALNLVRGTNLAWQTRKAASFVLTPFYSGFGGTPLNPDHAFRPTERFAAGLSLGTAFATSGAAVSPNWGYHSTPALAFLLTIFNGRLGRWLPNPRVADRWREAGPRFGLTCLLAELFGLADIDTRHVYLSDGGHFENLGLYELVRRRCQYIIVSDASCDPDCNFEDLGAAVHKCRVDFGIDITIDLTTFKRDADGRCAISCAYGEIRYPGSPTAGTLIYLKPSRLSAMPADLESYAACNDQFPHQSTGDQWFDEVQFESYRQLGQEIANVALDPQAAKVAQMLAAL